MTNAIQAEDQQDSACRVWRRAVPGQVKTYKPSFD